MNETEQTNPKAGTTFKLKDTKGVEHTYTYHSSKYGWLEENRPLGATETSRITTEWRNAGGINNVITAPKTYGKDNNLTWDDKEKVYRDKKTGQIATVDESNAATQKWHQDNLDKVQSVGNKINKGTTAIGNLVTGIADAVDTFKRGNGTRTFIDPTAKYDRANAELMREQSADLQQSAQRNLQIANRDERAEADKDAAAIAASQYQQKMSQIKGVAGGGAAALASMNTQIADPNVHRQRADQAHAKGTEQRQEANALQQQSMDARAIADDKDYRAMLNTKQAEEAHRLSTLSSRPQADNTKVNDLQKENNDNTKPPEDTVPKQKDNNIPGQKFSVYDLQQAFTLLGGKMPSGDPSKITAEGVQAAREYLISQFGSEPGTYDYESPKSNLGTNKAHQYMQQMRDLYMEGLDKNKNVKTTVAATTLKKGTDGIIQDTNGDGVIDEKDNLGSDKNIKHIIKAVNRRFL